MKKLTMLLMVLLCLLAAGVASAQWVELNGLGLEIPDLPVAFTNYEVKQNTYTLDQRVSWSFDMEERAVLQITLRCETPETDYLGYADSYSLTEKTGAVVVSDDTHMTVVFPQDYVSKSFFVMTKAAVGYYLSGAGIVNIAYQNDALTDEECLAAVSDMLSSVVLTGAEGVGEVTSTEYNVDTEEDVQRALAECVAARPGEIKLRCSEGLYQTLSADSFAGVTMLCTLAGMSDEDVRYSSSLRMIKLYGITYSDISVCAQVDTMAEAEAAVNRFCSMNLASFKLVCSDAVYADLATNKGIYSLMAVNGLRDVRSSKSGNILTVSDFEPFSMAWAVASDVYSAADQINAWRNQGITEFDLVFDRETYAAMTDDDWRMIQFLSSIDYSWVRKNTTACYKEYTSVTWYDSVPVYCATEEDIVDAFRAMGVQGITNFRIMTTQETYDRISADRFAGLFELQAQGGVKSADMSYSGSGHTLHFEDAEIEANARVLGTVEEAIAYVDEAVARQDSEITMFMTAELYDQVMTGIKYFGKSDALIYDLIANSGICDCDTSYSSNTHVVMLKNVVLYPGTRIMQAVLAGNEASLSARDQETLEAAWAMVEQCFTGSELDTLRNIHDALCARIVYTLDDDTDEDDCATGALLNGEANCDGYADALYLVGSLAGLQVRYQHGDSVEQGLGSLYATHIWNLVCIDGTWRMVDVTWDDQKDSDPYYIWFNIGEDRASRTHVWGREMTVPMQWETDAATRVEQEFSVTDEADVRAALKARTGAVVYLYVTDDSTLDEQQIRSILKDVMTSSYSSSWIDGMNCMRVEMLAR